MNPTDRVRRETAVAAGAATNGAAALPVCFCKHGADQHIAVGCIVDWGGTLAEARRDGCKCNGYRPTVGRGRK